MLRWAPLVRLAMALLAAGATPAMAQGAKLGPLAQRAATLASGSSPVIVRAIDRASVAQVSALIKQSGGTLGRALPIIDAQTGWLPNAALKALADNSAVRTVIVDRTVVGTMERTGATIGAPAVRESLGLDGSGVGVAIVDSGVTPWHDDLGGAAGGQRVAAFVDFVNGQPAPYDDSGHGTHVAGIVAGNGFDSGGGRTGIAPGASLIVLKALDANGGGRISNVIAALDYVLTNKDSLNIRVVNLSLATAVYMSYADDPLTVAAKRLVDAGIVVVAAAGNGGVDAQGHGLYGSITSPGNAPWVLTVGASSHMGTPDRSDDTMAAFSSRGPSAIDFAAKPDLVAPGVGIESLSDPASSFYAKKAAALLTGTVPTAYLPYLSLSGTSMAAPVVAGTVALMMQANPALTPNEVKAILEYTAQIYPHYNRLTQGAGFLNARGAVELARALAPGATAAPPSTDGWGRQFIWGNHLVRGGTLTASARAWGTDVTWGAAVTSTGATVDWGVLSDGVAPWQAACADAVCSAITYGPGVARNVVWGSTCNGGDCTGTWSIAAAGAAVTTTSQDPIVVWGSGDDSIVVWGSSDDGIVVWGSTDDSIVVWGSECPGCVPVVWGR